MSIFKIAMRAQVTDSVSGFAGTVTARAEYLTGCRQYLVMPKADKNKLNDGGWFDEDRLLVKPAPKRNLGGPQAFPAPTK